MVSSEALPVDDGRARFIILALQDPHLLECAKRNKIDPPIHTGYFHIGEANTLIFIVDEATPSILSSYAQRSTWQHDMNVQILADCNVTLHYIVDRSVVDSAGINDNETGWKNTRAMERNVRRRQ